MATRAVDKRRYYFSITAYGRIIDSHFEDGVGRPVEWYHQNIKRVWDQNFKLYNETEKILEKVEDPNNFELFPLYRGFGQDDEDFIFESRDAAIKEYQSQIEQSIAEKMYDL